MAERSTQAPALSSQPQGPSPCSRPECARGRVCAGPGRAPAPRAPARGAGPLSGGRGRQCAALLERQLPACPPPSGERAPGAAPPRSAGVASGAPSSGRVSLDAHTSGGVGSSVPRFWRGTSHSTPLLEGSASECRLSAGAGRACRPCVQAGGPRHTPAVEPEPGLQPWPSGQAPARHPCVLRPLVRRVPLSPRARAPGDAGRGLG